MEEVGVRGLEDFSVKIMLFYCSLNFLKYVFEFFKKKTKF